jgi:DNA-binding GntR family transcriptional regulator
MTQEPSGGLDGLGSAQRAYQLIRSSIIEGRYRAGQRLIEGRIGEEFSLSRTPVREALRLLEAEGLVLSIRNRGAIVRPVSPKEVIDLYELRARLESLGAERAATRATDAGIAELDAAIAAFDAAIPATDHIELTENRILSQANSRFHDAVIEMADHARLSQLMARTVDIPLVFQAFRVFTREERVRSNVFHRLIRDALEHGEAARAGALMSEHILMGRDSLVARLDEAQVKDALFLGASGEASSG